MTAWGLFVTYCPEASAEERAIFGSTIKQFTEDAVVMGIDRAAQTGTGEVNALRIRRFARSAFRLHGMRKPVATVSPSKSPVIDAVAVEALRKMGYKVRMAEEMVEGLEGSSEDIVRKALAKKGAEL